MMVSSSAEPLQLKTPQEGVEGGREGQSRNISCTCCLLVSSSCTWSVRLWIVVFRFSFSSCSRWISFSFCQQNKDTLQWVHSHAYKHTCKPNTHTCVYTNTQLCKYICAHRYRYIHTVTHTLHLSTLLKTNHISTWVMSGTAPVVLCKCSRLIFEHGFQVGQSWSA